MTKLRRTTFILLLLAAAVGLRAPYLHRSIWNIDEGVTFTTAQQVLDGAVIYRDAADHRNPLVPYLQAAVFAVTGDWNALAVHVSLALLLGLGAVGLWRLSRRLGDEPAGLVAAGFFTLLCFTLPDGNDAMSAHTEWYLILFSVAAFWSLSATLPQPGFRRGLVPGALFGLALLCKQPGLLDFGTALVLVALLALGHPAQRAAHARLLLGLAAGLGAVLAAAFAYFAWHHALPDLAYYAWTYNSRIYVPEIPLPRRLPSLLDPFHFAWLHVPIALVAGVLGAILMLATAARGLLRRPVEIPVLPWLALGWTAGGIISPALSGRGFSHYSIQVIPGLSLACGWGLVQLWRWSAGRHRAWRWSGAVLLALALAHTGAKLAQRYRDLAEITARPEMMAGVFREIRTHTRPDERIFVWGFAPDIHFSTLRLPNSRFLYSNFLNGLVPWSNLDPLQDTAYAVAPGSWEQLQADFTRTPAALIVDIGNLRGTGKYPLRERPWLWQLITRHYAEVATATAGPVGMHLYRRLPAADGRPLPTDTVRDDAVQLTLGYTSELHPIPKLSLRAPAGAGLVELYANGRLYRTFVPPDGLTDVVFFAPPADLPAGSVTFQAVVHYADARRTGTPVSVAGEDAAGNGAAPRGPTLTYGDQVLPPEQVNSNHAPRMTADANGRWIAHAPSWVSYALQPTMQALVFSYGLEPGSYDGSGSGRTDGIGVTVTAERADGTTTTLFTRTLDPANVDADRGIQTSRLELAATAARRVTIAIGPGPRDNYAFDWSYLAAVRAEGPGPDLVLGDGRRLVPAALLAPEGSKPSRDPDTGFWFPNVPSQLVYPCPQGLTSITFTFGLADTAIVDLKPGRHSDGIDARLVLRGSDGRRRELFQRRLQPLKTPADRGPQTATATLPADAEGQLVFELASGPAGNTDCDWGFWGDFRGTLRP